MKTGLSGVLLLLALVPVLSARADAEFTGAWAGTGWSGPVPHAVRLQLDADGGELRLGAPRACRARLLRDRQGYVVGVSETGGAACDRLAGRRLELRRDGDALRVDGASAGPLQLYPAARARSRAQTLELDEEGAGVVRLVLEAATPGDSSGEWRQGPPAACRAALQLAAVEADRDWHVFTARSSGGRCDRLMGAVLIVPVDPGRPVTLRDGDGRDRLLTRRGDRR